MPISSELIWKHYDLPDVDFGTGPRSPRHATLGVPGDGVEFSLQYMPSCYRRGPWRLLVEVLLGLGHKKWGCFDSQDQPLRWYHGEAAALSEAQAIARVLVADRERADAN